MERLLLFVAFFCCIAGLGSAFYLTGTRRTVRLWVSVCISGMAEILLLLFSVLGLSGIASFSAFWGVYLTLAAVVLCGVPAFLMRLRFPEGIARDGGIGHVGVFAIRLLAVLLLVETLICNSACYARIWKGAPETALSPRSGTTVLNGVKGYWEDDQIVYQLDPGTQKIEIVWENVQVPMGTIGFFFDTDAERVEYSVDFSDETNASYRNGLVKGTIYPSSAYSRYIVTDTSGAIDKLRVTLTLPKDTKTFTFREGVLTLNAQIPFHFSPLRVSLVYLLIFGLFLLLRGRLSRDEMSLHPRTAKGILIATVCGLSVLSVLLCAFRSSGFWEDWHMTTGNQLTKELVDAFSAGQLHLLKEPSEELLALENPYDWSQRSGISVLWDHLLYNGHYYSYYGIAPVLLLFLPYHLVTGYYFPSCWAVCLFGVIGIVFLGLTWHTFVKKFLPKLPLSVYIGGLIMLEAVSGVFYCYGVTNFYEIARSAGFCFVTVGAYFLLSANVVGEGKISLWRLAVSAAAFSFGVLSRPTEAVWCVVAVLFLFFGLRKHLAATRGETTGKRARSVVLYLVAALLPYVVIGSVQMIYNYLRFGSVLEFGIQYSLTINDFTRAEFGWRSAMIGFWNYLFAPPSFTDNFPFITSSFTKLDLNGYYFNATPDNAVGILFRALPVFALFAAPRILGLVEDRGKRIRTMVLGSAIALAAPAIIIFSIWESGYCVHYGMDFFWEMTICALGLVGLIITRPENRQVKNICCSVFAVTVLLSVLVNFALYFRFFDANSADVGYELFGRLFAFWIS